MPEIPELLAILKTELERRVTNPKLRAEIGHKDLVQIIRLLERMGVPAGERDGRELTDAEIVAQCRQLGIKLGELTEPEDLATAALTTSSRSLAS